MYKCIYSKHAVLSLRVGSIYIEYRSSDVDWA